MRDRASRVARRITAFAKPAARGSSSFTSSTVEPQELEYAKPQGVPDRGIGRARSERVDHVVERHAALDRPVGKALGEGAIARIERGAVRLRPEGPVREGAVGVHPAEHSQRDRPGGRGGHSL